MHRKDTKNIYKSWLKMGKIHDLSIILDPSFPPRTWLSILFIEPEDYKKWEWKINQ